MTDHLQDPIHPHPTSSTKPQASDANPASVPAASAPTQPLTDASQPRLDVEIGPVNQSSHLDGLVRVGEGDAMSAEEKKQKELLAGGGEK